MLRARIIPGLLLSKGGLVKTRNFSDAKYVGDPINAVKIFNEKEVDELALFDIVATAEGRAPNFALLKNIAMESRMPMCYGGGVTSAVTASRIVNIGFEKVSVSNAALRRPQLIREMAEEIGSQSVVVTLDVSRNKLFSGYTIFTHNGREKVKVPLLEFCQEAVDLGVGEIVINSIDRDGSMTGYDLELARCIRQQVSCPLTFFGGAGSTADMQALIDDVGVVGAGAGSMFVFKGIFRAVLISYARPNKLT